MRLGKRAPGQPTRNRVWRAPAPRPGDREWNQLTPLSADGLR